jgi:hypothetical protein
MLELTIADYLSMCRWYESLPPVIQQLAARFAPGTKWRLRNQGHLGRLHTRHFKSEDWFEPESFTANQMVNMVQFDAATGMMLVGVYQMRPQDLIPAGS